MDYDMTDLSVNTEPENLSTSQQESLLYLQRDVLESVATSNEHGDNLVKLCLATEAMLPKAVASIMLFDNSHENLVVRTAPSIPDAAILQLNGLTPGPQAGSCGTAVYYKKPIYVENTATDNRWQHFGQFAIDFNICACWSNPITDSHGQVIGSFALSSFETRSPIQFQKELLKVAAYLSGIIIQREKIESELWNQIHVDPLTLLPNRTLLNQRLQHGIEISSRNRTKIALLFIDVDNFKMVNDSYGHTVGDEILIRVANAMKQAVREQDTVARTGGDEFTILLEDINDPLDASKVAQKILDSTKESSHLEDIEITLSIGTSIYPDDTQDQEELLRNADTAMYATKAAGKNSHSFYKPELTQAVQAQITLQNELRQALRNDEFVLFFQPIFNNTGQKIEGAETLIRWNHPTKGLVMPNDFIPAAEENGLINEITQWVMLHACTTAKKWLNNGIELKKLSINLSASEISLDCYKKVEMLLEQTGYPANRLELEITETMLMEQGQRAFRELEKIRELDVSIALDDFGTGYSSLHLLRRLPIDKLKIDRSFIMELPQNQDDITLTKLIISMGKSLSLQVVAEGVETEQQRHFLSEEGCDLLQGFLLSKPLPEEDFLEKFKLHA